MKINRINQIEKYTKAILDYKKIRNRLSSKESTIASENVNYVINTRRVPNDLVTYIIDTNLQFLPKAINTEKKKVYVQKCDEHLGLLRQLLMLDRIDCLIEKLSMANSNQESLEVTSAYKQIKNLYGREKIFFDNKFDNFSAQSVIRIPVAALVINAMTTNLGVMGSKEELLGTFGSLTLANYVNDKIEDANEYKLCNYIQRFL